LEVGGDWGGKNLLEGLSVGFCEHAHDFGISRFDGIEREEDTRFLGLYIFLGDVLHDIFKSFRSLGNFKRGGRGDIMFCDLTSTSTSSKHVVYTTSRSV
jgi:hypothetical protein